MSSFVDQMEHRDSTQSLTTSTGGSEFGSHYRTESGFYITSFAATIFISALVIVVVLFITLMSTLTVMLESCQNKHDGVIELPKTSDEYSYCRIVALHAEFNSLEVNDFPTICNSYANQYIHDGQYLNDLNLTLGVAYSYFSKLTPQDDGLDVVLMDIDDSLTSIHPYHTSLLSYRPALYNVNNRAVEAKLHARILILEFYSKLQASGWSLILMSRKPQKQWNTTIEILISFGYKGWTSLIMRSDDELQMDSWEYLSIRRTKLQNLGFRITSTISSKLDALSGPCLGKRIFKLPTS